MLLSARRIGTIAMIQARTIILRKFFLYDRKLLGKLSQCAAKSLTKFFKITLGKKTGMSGCFFVMPKVNLQPLTELSSVYVLKMSKKEGLIDDTFIKNDTRIVPSPLLLSFASPKLIDQRVVDRH